MAAGVTIWQGVQIFAVVFTMVFSMVIFIEGAFSAYFGRGKSRTLGIVLVLLAVAISGGFFLLAGPIGSFSMPLLEIAVKGILYIASGLVAAFIALSIFLFMIVRT